MADRYATSGAQTIASPADTIVTLIASTSTRGKLYDVLFGHQAAADNAIALQVRRFTAAGTGTAVTENALDSDAPTNQLTSDENHTAEPTYTANSELIHTNLNQRALFRWVAAPEGELWVPATMANGIGVEPSGSGAGDADCTLHWYE